MFILPPVVTIDGPSGAGKSTLCYALANKFRWQMLDSGAFYRALVLSAIHKKINIKPNKKLIFLATNLNVKFKATKKKIIVILDGKDVTQEIRNELISKMASLVGTFPKVRKVLLCKLRKFRLNPGLIADGRDMGTIVFPNNSIKIFLHAAPEVRANRRLKQLQKKGFNVKLKNLMYNIKQRDCLDSNRVIAPLIPAKDALILDSTNLSINCVLKKAITYIEQRLDIKNL